MGNWTVLIYSSLFPSPSHMVICDPLFISDWTLTLFSRNIQVTIVLEVLFSTFVVLYVITNTHWYKNKTQIRWCHCCMWQSQFRFDNECHLSLPDNHKRVSASPNTSEPGMILSQHAAKIVSSPHNTHSTNTKILTNNNYY